MNDLLEQCLLGQQDMRAYALVDGAMLHLMPTQSRKLWPAARAVSLFGGVTHDEVIHVGPLLFSLSTGADQHQKIKALVDQQSGLSTGSIILTPWDLSTLSTELRKYIDVRLEGGVSMIMRFYDSRVLPHWWEALPLAHRYSLSRICTQWLYWDEGLRPAKLALEASDKIHFPEFPVSLTQMQEDSLLTDMQPHMLIERFRREDPALLATIPAPERYDFFQMQIKNAATHGISMTEDLEMYCYLALRHGAQFNAQAEFKSILKLKAEGATWAEALTAAGN